MVGLRHSVDGNGYVRSLLICLVFSTVMLKALAVFTFVDSSEMAGLMKTISIMSSGALRS